MAELAVDDVERAGNEDMFQCNVADESLNVRRSKRRKVNDTVPMKKEKVDDTVPMKKEKVDDTVPTKKEKVIDTVTKEKKKVDETMTNIKKEKVNDTVPTKKKENVNDTVTTKKKNVNDTVTTKKEKVIDTVTKEKKKVDETMTNIKKEKVNDTVPMKKEKVDDTATTKKKEKVNDNDTVTTKKKEKDTVTIKKDEPNAQELRELCCPDCSETLVSGNRVRRVNAEDWPELIDDIFDINSRTYNGVHQLLDVGPCPNTVKATGVSRHGCSYDNYNSYYSQADGCCVQLLQCKSCTEACYSSGDPMKIIGFLVRLADGTRPQFTNGKVWLVNPMVN